MQIRARDNGELNEAWTHSHSRIFGWQDTDAQIRKLISDQMILKKFRYPVHPYLEQLSLGQEAVRGNYSSDSSKSAWRRRRLNRFPRTNVRTTTSAVSPKSWNSQERKFQRIVALPTIETDMLFLIICKFLLMNNYVKKKIILFSL